MDVRHLIGIFAGVDGELDFAEGYFPQIENRERVDPDAEDSEDRLADHESFEGNHFICWNNADTAPAGSSMTQNLPCLPMFFGAATTFPPRATQLAILFSRSSTFI